MAASPTTCSPAALETPDGLASQIREHAGVAVAFYHPNGTPTDEASRQGDTSDAGTVPSSCSTTSEKRRARSAPRNTTTVSDMLPERVLPLPVRRVLGHA